MRFDQKASRYHEIASIQKTVADWCAEWIEDDCRKFSGLELGAGTGLFTKHLAFREFREFLATDISRPMLEEGRKRLPLVNWKKLDAWRIDLGAIDRIYACSLLQWASNPVGVMEKWRCSLQADGRILASFFIKGSLQEFNRKDERFSAFPWRSESEWKDIVRAAGLRILRSGTRLDVVPYESPREALRLIHDIGAIEENRMGPVELKRFLARSKHRDATSFDVSWRAMRVECVAAD